MEIEKDHLDIIKAFPHLAKVDFLNKISGFKSANLIATQNEKGLPNLAIFNTVVHLGANPPLLGFISRPETVQRHTISNIRKTKYYSINAISSEIFKKAHHTSAKYDAASNEFHKSNLQEEIIDDFPIPFVKESPIKIGMQLKEEILIKSNNTILVVGEVIKIDVPKIFIKNQKLDLEKADLVTIAGLNCYYKPALIEQLPFARPQ